MLICSGERTVDLYANSDTHIHKLNTLVNKEIVHLRLFRLAQYRVENSFISTDHRKPEGNSAGWTYTYDTKHILLSNKIYKKKSEPTITQRYLYLTSS